MLDARQKADYGVGFYADESDATHAINEAAKFYLKINDCLNTKH